jgi:hypothetical protein
MSALLRVSVPIKSFTIAGPTFSPPFTLMSIVWTSPVEVAETPDAVDARVRTFLFALEGLC